MTTLMEMVEAHQGRPFVKTDIYIDVYETYLRKFRNRPVNMLEIGVFKGGSLQIFKKYLGKKARIFGLDINPDCQAYDEDRIKVYIGDQEDKVFMKALADKLPKLHIVLDDGGHSMAQQINTFEVLYPRLALGGAYICEDTSTSYWPNYGAGLKQPGTFIEYMKDRVDDLQAFYVKELDDLSIARSTAGIHFYHGMVVLEKRKMKPMQLVKRSGED